MLITTPNLAQSDDFYAALLRVHEGLDQAQMHALNARLVLVLANHIGDLDTLTQALDLARAAGPNIAADTAQDATKA